MIHRLLALKLLVKIRQDEVFFGPREPTHVVLSIVPPSTEERRFGPRTSKSARLTFKLARTIPTDKPPLSAAELTKDDHMLADRLVEVGLSLLSKHHEGGKVMQVRTLNLGVRFDEHAPREGHQGRDIRSFAAITTQPKPATSSSMPLSHKEPHSAVSQPSPGDNHQVGGGDDSYWGASRLSFIGSWKTRWRKYMRELRKVRTYIRVLTYPDNTLVTCKLQPALILQL